jgi:hypothetical protein
MTVKNIRDVYRGWDILVCCTRPRRPVLNFLKRDVRFSAVGYAVLRKDIAHPDDWVDPRPQTVTLGCREFSTETQCTEILMGEIRVLIDALRKSP